MAYKIKGRVTVLTPTQTLMAKSGNSYQSRYMVITAIRYDQYTGQPTEDPENTPKFTFFGKQCEALDNIKIGDIVTVSFDLNGRAYDKDGQREYFTEVRPFRVDVDNQPISYQQPQYQPTAPASQPYAPQQEFSQNFAQSPAMNQVQSAFPNAEVVGEGDDDLPF